MKDPSRTYSFEEEERLAYNLKNISEQVHRGSLRHLGINSALICFLHEHLFQGIRPHAGRVRHVDWGTEYLIFGPNRSAHRKDVVLKLEKVFIDLKRSIASFDANIEHPEYDSKAFYTAVWAHAEIINIHPFEDGNGRSTRLLMNWVLIRLGLHPISMDTVKLEYSACLNEYFLSRNIQPLLDLCLRVYRI